MAVEDVQSHCHRVFAQSFGIFCVESVAQFGLVRQKAQTFRYIVSQFHSVSRVDSFWTKKRPKVPLLLSNIILEKH